VLGIGASGETNNDLWKVVSNTTDMQILMTQNYPHMWLDGLGVVADLDDIKTHIWTITDAVQQMPDAIGQAVAQSLAASSATSSAGSAAQVAADVVNAVNTSVNSNTVVHVHAPNGAALSKAVMSHLQAVSPAFKAKAV